MKADGSAIYYYKYDGGSAVISLNETNVDSNEIKVNSNVNVDVECLGGAFSINTNDIDVKILNTNLTNNAITSSNYEADHYEGASGAVMYLYGRQDSSISISNTNITDNFIMTKTHAHGGALYIYNGNYENFGTLSINECNIDNNEIITKDGLSAYGGAIYSYQYNIIINRSNITNNELDLTTSISDAEKVGGGAIYVESGSVNVTDSNITGNKINIKATNDFDYSYMTLNAYGGAICVESGSVNVTDSDITYNHINIRVTSDDPNVHVNQIEARGGAIYCGGYDFVLSLCQRKIENNKIIIDVCTQTASEDSTPSITVYGGAISYDNFSGTAKISLEETNVDSNEIKVNSNINVTATCYGGAIAINTNELNVEITNTNLTNNAITSDNVMYGHDDGACGAALYIFSNQDSSISISNTNITDNSVLTKNQGRGGALYVYNAHDGILGTLSISECNIENNEIITKDGLSARGGAIYSDYYNINIVQSNITNNRLYLTSVSTSYGENTPGGGAIYSEHGSLKAAASQITNNHIDIKAIFNDPESNDNEIKTYGGAIWYGQSDEEYEISFTQTRIENNRIDIDVYRESYNENQKLQIYTVGGAIHVGYGSSDVKCSRIEFYETNIDSNQINIKSNIVPIVKAHGGAISLHTTSNSITIENTNITNNGINTVNNESEDHENEIWGGALYIGNTNEATITIFNTNITDNYIITDNFGYGGAVYIYNNNYGTLSISATNIENNRIATRNGLCAQGGALYSYYCSINIVESSITNNKLDLKAPQYPYRPYSYGGALCVLEASLNVEKTNITNNQINIKATYDSDNNVEDICALGGAIYYMTSSDYQLELNDIDVENNQINIDVHVESIAVQQSLNILAEGGAIYAEGAPLSVSNMNLTDNSIGIKVTGNYQDVSSMDVCAQGGALYYKVSSGQSQLSFSQNKVENNKISIDLDMESSGEQQSPNIIAEGGAIYLFEDGGSAYVTINLEETNINANRINIKSNIVPTVKAHGGVISIDLHGTLQATIQNTNITNNAINTVNNYDYNNENEICGGALYFAGHDEASVTIDYTNITDNYIIADNFAYGGALYFSKSDSTGTLRMSGSNVENNKIVTRNGLCACGGAIYLKDYDNVNIEESNISWNKLDLKTHNSTESCAYGGAICSEGSNGEKSFNVIDSDVVNNQINIEVANEVTDSFILDVRGGAIYVNVALLNVDGSGILNNQINIKILSDNSEGIDVDAYGGAIYNYYSQSSNSEAKISLSNIKLNGINFDLIRNGENNNPTITLKGGAIYYESGDSILRITESSFVSNYLNINDDNEQTIVHLEGGAISNVGHMTISDTNFTKNNIINPNKNSEDSYAYGGAISANGYSKQTEISNSNFTLNSITYDNTVYGGAVYCENGDLKISDAYFISNSVNTKPGTQFDDEASTSDEKSARGGAIYAKNNEGTLDITNTKFYYNKAETEGGAIYRESGKFKISYSEFRNNTPENFALTSDDAITLTYPDNFIPNEASVTVYLGDSQDGTQTTMDESKITNYPIAQGLTPYKLVVTMDDGANYNDGVNEFIENVFYLDIEHNLLLTVEANPYVNVGDQVNITGNLYTTHDENIVNNEGLAGKTITLYINGTLQGTTTTNSTGGYNFTYIANTPGYQNVSVNLTGDENIPSLNKTTGFYVIKEESNRIATNITIEAPDTYVYNSSYSIKITVYEYSGENPAKLPCNITLMINGEAVDLELTTGEYVYEFTPTIVGNISVVAYYGGNQTYNSSFNRTSFIVSKRNTTITAVQNNTVKENITINYSVNDTTITPETPITSGTITILDEEGNIVKSAKFNEETNTITITDFEPGEYTLTIIYNGNYTHNQSSQELTVKQLPKANITIKVLNNTEGNVTIEYSVTNGTSPIASADVTITLPNGTTTTKQTDLQGKITITDATVTEGDRTTTATIESSDDYIGATETKELTVIPEVINPIPTQIVIVAPNTYVNNGSYKFKVTVYEIIDGDASKLPCNITLVINDVSRTLELTSGETMVDYMPTIVGSNTIVAYFAENATHNSSMNKSTFNVDKRLTQITAAQDSSIKDNVTISYNVVDVTVSPSSSISNGTITVLDEEGNIVKSAKFDEETNIVSITDLEPGLHTLTIVYNGNYTHNQSSQELTVKQLPKANITIKVLNNTEGNVTIEYSVTNGTSPIASADVTITLPNGTTTTEQTDLQGKITLMDATVKEGDRTTTAMIESSDGYIGTISSKEVTIVHDYTKEIEELKANLTEAQNTIKELEDKNENLTKQVEELTQNLTDAKNTIKELTQNLTEAQNTINNLKQQLADAQNTIKELNQSLIDANNEIKSLTKEIKVLNNTIKELQKEIDKMQEQIDLWNKTSVIRAVPENNTVGSTLVVVTLDNKLSEPITNAEIIIKDQSGKTIGTGKTDKKGVAVIAVDTPAGIENITAIYKGSSKYTASNTTVSITTYKINTIVTVDPVEGVLGEDINFTVHVKDVNFTSVSGGNVVVKLNGKSLRTDGRFDSNAPEQKLKVNNGKVTFTLKVDTYLRNAKNLTASYSGSSVYNSARSEIASIQIRNRTAKITVTAKPSSQKQYKTITFKATVKDTTPNSKNKTAVNDDTYVIFKINGKTLKDASGKVIKVKVKKGKAIYKYTVPKGMAGVDKNGRTRYYNLTCVLSSKVFGPSVRGDTYFMVERSPVKISFKKVTVNSKNQLSVKAYIKDYKNKKVKGTSTVNIKVNGKTYVNPKTKKVQKFKVKGGVINLKNLKIKKSIKIKKVTVVVAQRQAYLGQRKTTKKIVKV